MANNKENILQAVKDRMAEIKGKKAADLDKIQQEKENAETALEAATTEMDKAAQTMDVSKYMAAEAKRQKAQTALNMYSWHARQLKQQEYISEAESDRVIDSLLAYEDGLTEDFKAAMAEPINRLAELYADYTAAISDAEQTLTAWQQDVHANYRTWGRMHRTDPQTGKTTDRSETPTPVHRIQSIGCMEAVRLGSYLKSVGKE